MGIIQGRASYEYGHEVFALVYLLKANDTSLVKLSITDSIGHFHFDDLKPGKYIVKATLLGYTPVLAGPFSVEDVGVVQAPLIKLTKASIKLKGVDIVASPNFIDVKPDRTVINVQNSILASGKSAMEIMQKAPGVRVDNDNQISLYGRSGVLITIDNKPTNLPADALIELLQSTPGSNIAQVELIGSPGATYDAAGTGGIINIVTKRSTAVGTSVFVNNVAGGQQVGDGHPIQFRSLNAVIVNYRNKLFNWFFNYTFSVNPLAKIIALNRQVDFNGQINNITEDYFGHQSQLSNQYRLGTDLNLKSGGTIGVLLYGTTVNYNQYENVNTFIADVNTKPDSSFNTNSKLNSNSSNNTVDLNYRSNGLKIGDIMFDAAYSRYDKSRDKVSTSNYYYSGYNLPYTSEAIQDIYPVRNDILVFSANYRVKSGKSATLRVNLKSSFVWSHNQSDFSEQSGSIFVPNNKFSNTFDYNEKINAAGLTYGKLLSQSLNLEIGLRAEHTYDDGMAANLTLQPVMNHSESYTDLFPSALITKTLNKDNSFTLSYSKRISRPEFEYLNPFLNYVDPYNYNLGNPNLRPVYANNFELLHVYQSNLSTRLLFSVVNNFSQAVYSQNDTTKVVTTTRMNIGTRYQYGVFIKDSFTPINWWKFDIDVEETYQRFVNTAQNAYLNNNSEDLLLSMQNQLNISKTLRAEVFGRYEIPTVYGIYKFQSEYDVDAALSKSFASNRAILRLTVMDIFNKDTYRFSTNYQNLDLSGLQKTTFRMFQLRFMYNFGGKNTGNDGRRTTGTEELETRAAASGN